MSCFVPVRNPLLIAVGSVALSLAAVPAMTPVSGGDFWAGVSVCVANAATLCSELPTTVIMRFLWGFGRCFSSGPTGVSGPGLLTVTAASLEGLPTDNVKELQPRTPYGRSCRPVPTRTCRPGVAV